MPGSSTQVRRSDNVDWWCARPLPQRDSGTPPFQGIVSGETPALCYQTSETRRRDVGVQHYGGGTPTSNNSVVDVNGLLMKPRR